MTDRERELAERLYVSLATSQYAARVRTLRPLLEAQPANKVRARMMRDALHAWHCAADDARSIFASVLRGEVSPDGGETPPGYEKLAPSTPARTPREG